MLITALTIVRVRNIFAVVILSGIYSLLMAVVFTILDAVDVAFTEAAVGAGVTTVLALAALALTVREERPSRRSFMLPLAVTIVTGGVLMYAVPHMPEFGSASAPVHQHVAPRYISETPEAIGIPNVVTAVLADYRGYDTLGEVTVIFTAGIGVLLLLGRRLRRNEDDA